MKLQAALVLIAAAFLLAGCMGGQQYAGESAPKEVSGELGVFDEDGSIGDESQTPPAPPAREARAQDEGAQPPLPPQESVEASADSALAGSWRIYSERLFYDVGGAGALGLSTSTRLNLNADGTWGFGSSQGTWRVGEATQADWDEWGVSDYGPKKKMVLEGWNGASASGPIEETAGSVDFVWIIYSVKPPQVQNAGKVHVKFGR